MLDAVGRRALAVDLDGSYVYAAALVACVVVVYVDSVAAAAV